MPANFKNAAVATGLEKVSFPSNPKERQCQRMFKLPHNCTHLRPSKSESEVTQSCLTLCDPMDCSLLGSSVHGIFQARLLEWIAISFSRRSSRPRNRTWVSHIAGRRFTIWATRDASKVMLKIFQANIQQMNWELQYVQVWFRKDRNHRLYC